MKVHPQDLRTLNPEESEERLQSWDAESVEDSSVVGVVYRHQDCESPGHHQECVQSNDKETGKSSLYQD